MIATTPANPFPIEAVATYGDLTRTCENLDYMREAAVELHDYLGVYPRTEGSYGAAIGLQGGHGSGKTHLLTWLAAKARNLSSIEPVVLYAKADEANFYNLYSQLMEKLTREQLQRFLSIAIKNIAIEQVQQAKATEDIRKRINTPEDLPKLYEEKNLARDQLFLSLQEKLEETKVPIEIPRTLMQIDSATYGQKAYEWLIGNRIAPCEELGLTHNLLELTERGTAVPDTISVNALETVGVLLNLAEVPLIILIDQMEVLFRVEDYERRETLFSVIKKLIEHLKRQKALLFLAGSDEVWEKFSRDITPRLRSRKPIRVGALLPAETEIFLDSFTEERGTGDFSDTSVEAIQKLSGGSPREILRIAHRAFTAVNGNLGELTDVILLDSAEKSGSIADRHQLVISIAEKVLSEFGTPLKGLEAEGGGVIDFLLMVERVPCLALVTAKATDSLSEVNSARRIQTVRASIKEKWPTAKLVVVSVGYSSREIKELLSETSTVMEFDERQFGHQLRAKAAEIVTQTALPRSQEDSTGSQLIEKALDRIAVRLDRLEAKRTDEAERVADRFNEKADELARPETEKRELRSRYELLDEVDALQDTLLKGWEEWQTHGAFNIDSWNNERQRIKSILISNETNLKIKNLEQVGALYQELLAEESGFRKELDRLILERRMRGEPEPTFPTFAKATRTEKAEDPRWILSELLRVRLYLIKIMRRLLQAPRMLDKWLERPLLYAFVPTGVLTGLWLLGIWWVSLVSSAVAYEIERFTLWGFFFLRIFPIPVLSFGISLFLLFFLRWARVRRWDRDVEWVKRLIRRYEVAGSPVST